jgi:FdhE protein
MVADTARTKRPRLAIVLVCFASKRRDSCRHNAMTPNVPDLRNEERWNARLSRAQELAARHAAATAILRFYEQVLGFQRDVARTSTVVPNPDLPLRRQLDLPLAAAKLPELLQLTAGSGPALLAGKAKALLDASAARGHELFQSELIPEAMAADDLTRFFARACLQPLAENLQLQLPGDENYTRSVCPACGAPPQQAVLRPEGDGAKRSLMCSFCLREWLFRRLVCPWCGEENKDKLAHYSAEGHATVRVEACDTCKRYLKAVDLTADGHAVPLVDEVAWSVLDFWAVEQGYKKIVLNLMGL